MEIRFSVNYDTSAIFGIVYQKLITKYNLSNPEQLPILKLPQEIILKDENLKYQPFYRLRNTEDTNHLIQVGPQVFSIIYNGEYPGWTKYKALIHEGLTLLKDSGVVKEVTRFALRYYNFFDSNVLKESQLTIKLGSKNLNEVNTVLSSEIENEGHISRLQTHTNTVVTTVDKKTLIGSVIDIDTSKSMQEADFFSKADQFLEECHNEEKRIFYSIMSEKNLSKFNIEYA